MLQKMMKALSAFPFLVTVALFGTIALGSPASATAKSQSASEMVAGALSDARASGWVHEESTSTYGLQKGTLVDDIGTHEGRQVVTVAHGGRAEIIALDQAHEMFVRANSVGLVDYFGFTTISTATYGEKWIELTPSDSGYANVAFGTTLASDFSQIRLTGALKLGAVTIVGGQKVRPISGTVPAMNGSPRGTGVLYVTTSGRLLPVKFHGTTGTLTTTVSWSKWGTKVKLSAPSGAVPFPN